MTLIVQPPPSHWPALPGTSAPAGFADGPRQILVLLPAVDVADGKASRLVQGEAGSEMAYGGPLESALRRQEDGGQWVHLVDSDAAFGGRSKADRNYGYPLPRSEDPHRQGTRSDAAGEGDHPLMRPPVDPPGQRALSATGLRARAPRSHQALSHASSRSAIAAQIVAYVNMSSSRG
jgi:Histidine biosynthesis protein